MTETPNAWSAEALEANDDVPSNASANPTMGDIIAVRMSRRDILRGSLAVSAIAATVSPLALAAGRAEAAPAMPEGSTFYFNEITAGVDENHHIAKGHSADILIRWGDPVLPGAPKFDPQSQTAAKQAQQFGYNCDFVGYAPIDGSNERGLLCINHEYTEPDLMFPGFVDIATQTKEQADIEMNAHGGSIVEIKRASNGKWRVIRASAFNRRITASTPMVFTGPATGSDRLKTSADTTGLNVLGMLNNCAGAMTPWGTWLTCEENFNGYFGGTLAADHPEATNHRRYGVSGFTFYAWSRFYDRFDLAKEPNEPNRFGWVVEIDPFDPNSVPKKRTALGRFKHEGAANIINKDGRFVVYQGDDQAFDYVYRFVTDAKVDLENRENNLDILDEGTLFVAKFREDGTGRWLPLTFGKGPLTPENGFNSQADVLIEARRASDLLGATKMDRPEDMEANPVTKKVYLMLTNNTSRTAEQTDAANPRARNAFGHVIEITPAEGDNHARPEFTWDILLRCGDPAIAEVGATFNAATTENGWFGMPDNCAVDHMGRLWITTDGNSLAATGRSDGVWAIETEGELRGTSRHFYRVPVGAEMCGPYFTPDDRTLFLAVQHPGSGGGSTFEAPTTRWPDFKDGVPPRPSVVAVTKNNGGPIGGKPRQA